MNPLTIDCPNCHEPFELTEALASPILEAERKKARANAAKQVESEREAIEAKARTDAESVFAKKITAHEAALAESDAKLEAAKQTELDALKVKAEAEQAKRDVELTVRRQIDAERAEIEKAARESAAEEVAAKLKAANDTIVAKDAKLKEAEAAEIEARRLKAEAEEEKRQTELVVARRMDEERAKVREQIAKERDEQHRLDVLEKDRQLDAMRKQIEALRRKGAQGSQQLAGDVLEIDLLETLQGAFPDDQFERVKKGHRGADILHTVCSLRGAPCGRILWESKRTKTWQDGWLPKLRDDQREARADLAAIATETLPDDVRTFAERDGVWITCLPTVVPVAASLRYALIEVANARRASTLADSVKDQVFGYLTSPHFRQRVSRIVEGYVEMRSDLDKEKRATATQWSKREKQLERILGGVTGMYGDLQGIVGASLPHVDGLALTAPDENDVDAIAQSEAGEAESASGEVH